VEFVDELKAFGPSLIEPPGGSIVAASGGDCIRLLDDA